MGTISKKVLPFDLGHFALREADVCPHKEKYFESEEPRSYEYLWKRHKVNTFTLFDSVGPKLTIHFLFSL